MKHLRSILFFLICLLGFHLASFAAESVPYELQGVGIEEHLGAALPTDLEFTDHRGETVTLKNYLVDERPVILMFVYYECPNLCTLLLNGFLESVKAFDWDVGEKYQVVAISIDPTETAKLAAEKRDAYLKEYGRGDPEGWHFLVGSEANIQAMTQAVGFKYRYDAEQEQYAHASAIYFLTPDARISRYLYGIQFNPRDLKLALLEASEGKIGSVVDRFLLFCYHYDPKGKEYALFATNLMKIAGAATVLILGFVLWILAKRKPA